MKVILKADVKGSGKAGDLVEVSDGYAKNFLLKKGLAEAATAQNMAEKASKDAATEHHRQEELAAAQAVGKKLEGQTVNITAKAGAGGKLFGSVTSKEIAQALSQQFKIDADKRKINLQSDIKAFGTYNFTLKLHTKVTANMKVSVTEK